MHSLGLACVNQHRKESRSGRRRRRVRREKTASSGRPAVTFQIRGEHGVWAKFERGSVNKFLWKIGPSNLRQKLN